MGKSLKKGPKKAQAAMEFLLNYGWVFLIVIIVLAALAYFGVLKPANLIPEKCIFKAGFDCLDYSVNRYDDGLGGIVKLKLMNSLGETATIESLDFVSSSMSLSCTNPSNTQLSPGKAEFIIFSCSGNFPEKEKVKLEISGKYHTKDASFTKEIYGELTSKVMTVPRPVAGVTILPIPEEQYAIINQPVQYQLKITNTGTDMDTYKIYVGNAQPVEMTIPAGNMIYPFTLTFTEAPSDPSTLVRVESTTNTSLYKEDSVMTHVRTAPDFGLSVSPTPTFKIVESGSSAEYTIIVKNLGFDGIVKLETETLNGNPSISFSENNFNLPIGTEESVTMTVTPSISDTLIELKLKGKLETTKFGNAIKEVDGIQAIVACKGFTMDISQAKVYFFNSKIDFGGPIAAKEDASYPDIVLPTSYKVTVTGSAGTDSIIVTNLADAKFNIVKTGLVSSIDVVPVATADGTVLDCDGKKAAVNVKNLDPDDLEITQIWKVWDDGGSFGSAASTTSPDSYSGEKVLSVNNLYGSIPVPNSAGIPLDQADAFIFAYKDVVYTVYGGFEVYMGGGDYYIGCHSCCAGRLVCNQPPGRWGGFDIPCYLGTGWTLVKAGLDKIVAIPAPYSCNNCPAAATPCANVAKPTTPLAGLSISGWGPGNGYFDTIYFYSVK